MSTAKKVSKGTFVIIGLILLGAYFLSFKDASSSNEERVKLMFSVSKEGKREILHLQSKAKTEEQMRSHLNEVLKEENSLSDTQKQRLVDLTVSFYANTPQHLKVNQRMPGSVNED